MTNDIYLADKVNELEKKVARLEKVIAKLVARETNKQRENEAEQLRQIQLDEDTANIGGSLLERAMLALDDYLNAGCKETRKQAAENAKFLYKEYYGVDYVNRNDR